MLAEGLGKHLHEIRELPAYEVAEWHAFYTVRQVHQDHEAKKHSAQ